MARERAYRKFQLTINNPLEHGFTHEIIRQNLEQLKSCLYWCLCDEIGEHGTPHTHIYAAFKNAVMFSTIQQRFYGAHIEVAKGSHRENRDYIRKEGKWRDTDKAETNLPETFEESCELPTESDRRVKQSEAILTMIEDGASDSEIIRAYPSAMNHLKSIEQARQTLLEEKYGREWREVDVTYIWGETGVGKTRSVVEKHGYRNVFRVTNYTHPFDGYKGQDVILFDEFRSSLKFSDMLAFIDGHPVMLPCRYADKVACYTKVYIISNIPLEKQYPLVQVEEPAGYAAFLRRINEKYEMLADDAAAPF